ncbi:serine/arginine-rich splicing factor 4-like isoform X2 [Dysidea avara]|uniref:serine/arginine-rich splicing factor 4-like isoform X2 n=1 Tax=Dysidea avara TaxID=196820 RepID=UPI00332F3A18
MHTVELKCTVPVGAANEAFFNNAKNVRDFFARDGSCTIINNWNETVMTDGQKVVRYTVVLKFDDQMVANSVKQKYNNKIIHGTRVYADWYNTAESKKNKKKKTANEIDEYKLLDDELQESKPYSSLLSFPEIYPTHDSLDSKSSTQLLHPSSSRRLSEERRTSPKSRSGSRSLSKVSRSSSRVSRDSNSLSVSPTPHSSSYRDHGSHSRSRSHRLRTPSWSPTRHSRSASSQDSSPIRDRKERFYLEPVASLNTMSTRSSTSIQDRMKFKSSYTKPKSRDTRSSKWKKGRALTPVHKKRNYRSQRSTRSGSRERRWSSHSDREVELDDDNLQRILSKEDKDEEQEDIKDEMLELGEINEGEFVDSFIGTQQHMNAFDLLLPTMEHQLRSGSVTSDSELSDNGESAPVDFSACKALIMKDYIERAKVLASSCNMLVSQDPSIAEHLRYSLHANLMKLGQMYLHGIQCELQRHKK